MPSSLLDQADLTAIRRAARGVGGRFGTVLATLLHGGVVQHDPADPRWADRDRLVTGCPEASVAADAALRDIGYPPRTGFVEAPAGPALALAFGMASASRIQGGIFRVWCLLEDGCAVDGEVWESLRAAADAGEDLLSLVITAEQRQVSGVRSMLDTAGWRAAVARAEAPAELLGAMDRSTLAASRPGAVLAVVTDDAR